MTLVIKNTTQGKLPRLPFARMTDTILGTDYECSFVIISSRKSRELNRTHRGKDYPTNILSFPLDENEGEIFLDLAKARAEAPSFERTYTNFVGFLFIHALLHLKGYDHGATMEKQEQKFRKMFGI